LLASKVSLEMRTESFHLICIVIIMYIGCEYITLFKLLNSRHLFKWL